MSTRTYASISPMFWTRGSGKRLRGHLEAQVVALYLMTSPHTSMIGIFNLALPTLCHEAGLTDEGARKGLAKCEEEQIAFYDEEDELVWVPALAKYQIGDELRLGKGGKADHRVAGVHRALTPFRGHRFHDLFLERYSVAYLLGEGSGEAPSKPLRRGHDPDPVPDHDPESVNPDPPRADPFGASFARPHADDIWVFQRWSARFGKTGAKFDDRRGRQIAERRLAGMTRQDAEDALVGASFDAYVIGKKDGHRHDRLSFIFGDQERFEEFRDVGRKYRETGTRPDAKGSLDGLKSRVEAMEKEAVA